MSHDKPDFLIIGAMKSATSSLYSDLEQNTDIFMPSDKEPWVLTEQASASAYKRRYVKIFSGAPEKKICGEATTGYAFAPLFSGVPRRAFELCGPELKIIYIVRDPVERAVSHLRHDIIVGRVNINNAHVAVTSDTRYIDVSNYPMQISCWLEFFSKDNIHVLSFDSFVKNRESELKRILEFLELDATHVNSRYDMENVSSVVKRPPMLIQHIVSSASYRQNVHRYIPKSVRNFGKKALLRNASVGRDYKPSLETMLFLNKNLAGVSNATNLIFEENLL